MSYSLLKSYIKNRMIRNIIKILYFINYVCLSLYLGFVPIQLAFLYQIQKINGDTLQTTLNQINVILFFLHIFLYCDSWVLQNQNIFRKSKQINQKDLIKSFLSIEIAYDIVTFLLSIFVLIYHKSYIQRIIELAYIFKLFKLSIFDQKITLSIIASPFFIIYRVLKALLAIYVTCSYVGSIIYGAGYLIYLYDVGTLEYYFDWLINSPTYENLICEPFSIQFEYTIYWALATSATAAYGDIVASDPIGIFLNMIVMLFGGFFYGLYINSLHSIPNELKQSQNELLENFKSFRKNSQFLAVNSILYLQVLCSLQYNFTQKSIINSLQISFPEQYLLQVKHHLYKEFIHIHLYNPLEPANALEIAGCIKQIICEQNQNIYQYDQISKFRDDLLFVNVGVVNHSLDDNELSIFDYQVTEKNGFNYYSFATGFMLKHTARCLKYCQILLLSRKDYKSTLKTMENKINFLTYKNKAMTLELVFSSEPMNFILQNIYGKYKDIYQKLLNIKYNTRQQSQRISFKSKKIVQLKNKTIINPNKKNIGIQTEKQILLKPFQSVLGQCNQFDE